MQQWPRVKSISDNMSVAGLVDHFLTRGTANEPAIKKVDRVLMCYSLKMGEEAFSTEEYSISKEISAFCTTNLSIAQHQKIVMKAVLKACAHLLQHMECATFEANAWASRVGLGRGSHL